MKRSYRPRRGFSIPELLLALTISGTLLLATMMALSASFRAFQKTTRTVSSGVSGRVVVERIQTLIRTGIDFGPLPSNPLETTVDSDRLEINLGENDWVTLRWDEAEQSLRWEQDGDSWPLLEGVTQRPAGSEDPVPPFTLQFREGRWLNRAVINLVVADETGAPLAIEGPSAAETRLIGSAMPRISAWRP